MKKFWNEFKQFAMKGNVVDMAVGVIIGTAFGKIVSSLVADIIMPLVGMLIGGVNFTDLKISLNAESIGVAEITIPAVTINYGVFLQTIFDFLIIAMSIFVVIRFITRLSKNKATTDENAIAPEAQAAPEPSEEVKLLREIRDLLQK